MERRHTQLAVQELGLRSSYFGDTATGGRCAADDCQQRDQRDGRVSRLATFVDRILRGARPADLPVELPTAVEFLVNAKTAQAIGVNLPQALLLRADRIIG